MCISCWWNRRMIVLLTAAWFCAVAYAGAETKAPFSLTIGAVNSKVSAGSQIWILVALENISGHEISVYREYTPDQGGFVYTADVRDEKATAVPETKFNRRLQSHDTPEEFAREPYVVLGSGGEQGLGPGMRMTDRIDVSRLYDLSRPGTYTIQVQRLDLGSKTFVRSNKISVTVTH